MPTNVLLVDDSRDVRERLRRLLQQQAPDIALVGEAADGAEALALLEGLPVDVVVMDISLPEVNGIDIAERILMEKPGVHVVIVSMHSNPHYVKAGFRAGVAGYLSKDCAFEELVTAVQTVAAGGTYVSPEIEIERP